DTLIIRGVNGDSSGIKGGLKFESRVVVLQDDGQQLAEKERIVVSNATRAMLLIAAATSYRSYKDTGGDPSAIVAEQLKLAREKTYFDLLAAHVEEYTPLFHRVKLDLGRTAAADLPTDQRPAKFLQRLDPHLATLYFQYGRYLLISSSRPGSQPANLQGIWNHLMTPPW